MNIPFLPKNPHILIASAFVMQNAALALHAGAELGFIFMMLSFAFLGLGLLRSSNDADTPDLTLLDVILISAIVVGTRFWAHVSNGDTMLFVSALQLISTGCMIGSFHFKKLQRRAEAEREKIKNEMR
jgi:hypothetical protein